MNFKNSEMANKLKGAFKKAGVNLSGNKNKQLRNKQASKKHKSAKSVQAASPNTDLSSQYKQLESKNIITKKRLKPKTNRQEYKPKMSHSSFPSYDSVKDAYHASPSKKAENKKDKNQKLTRTMITAKEGGRFKPTPIFDQNVTSARRIIIDEGPCSTQLSPDSTTEVQLVIGLDLGSSTTKVVIGDPDNKRFFAVPFSPKSENPYLVSTAILEDTAHNVIVDTGDSQDIRREIKLDLMQKKNSTAVINLGCYIAQIVRHSIHWFLSVHADDYRGVSLFWTMAMGLPVDSVRVSELERRFRLAAITGAQAAISPEANINTDNLDELLKQVEKDLSKLENPSAISRFEELGGDPGVVTVVPEIAAQVVGLYQSRRWDTKKPISFLIDIGAATVDAAVFSLVDAKQENKELTFCAFSCNVSELGVTKLHLERIRWLKNNLPKELPDREHIVQYLDNLRINGLWVPVPGRIDDYINHVEIVIGKTDDSPDRKYRDLLYDNVYQGVLMKARRKNESDSAWRSLKTMICGGGARSDFYQQYVEGLSKNTVFNLEVELLEKPRNLEAPGLPKDEYDRLSVAYGLAQGTQWEYRWPEGMENIPSKKTDTENDYLSKDIV